MKKSLVCIISVLMLLLTGCNAGYNTGGSKDVSGNEAEGEEAGIGREDRNAEAEPETGTLTEAPGGYPWIDSDIKANVLNTAKPDLKDDYSLAVNYEWLSEAKLREGYTYESPFVDVSVDTADRVKELLRDDSITGHDADLVHDLYNTVMDWDARNELGVEPAFATVREIMAISTVEEIGGFICDPDRSNCVDTFISIGNNIDLNNPDRYIVRINNDTLLLEDPAEYKDFTDVGDIAYEAKLTLFKTVSGKMGLKPEAAEAMFNSVLSLEEQIARASMTNAEKLGNDYYDRMNSVYSEDDIKKLTNSFPLYDFIEGLGYAGAGEYVISEPEVIKKLDELYTSENIEALKNYMVVHYLLYMADKLDRECYEACVLKDNMMSGAEGSPSDEDMACNAVSRYIHEPLERVYLEKYDCAAAREAVTAVCKEVIDTYREMLWNEDWLSEETKEKAVGKLDAITIKAVYPDKWQDYSGLTLSGLDYVSCVKEINRYKAELDRKHTGGWVDKELWRNKILTANAYYEPQENSINIGVGILGDVFYSDSMSREELLGGLGCAIGHEISHAFDETGSGFDSKGRLKEWWNEDDRRAFKERADRITAYYDGITPFEGYAVLGENVRNEAIADIAGMKVMLMMAGQENDFDYDIFFRQYAGLWKQIATYEREVYRLTRDEHPLNYLRVNTVLQQFDEFYDTYGIKEGDGMYLKPEDRIGVW